MRLRLLAGIGVLLAGAACRPAGDDAPARSAAADSMAAPSGAAVPRSFPAVGLAVMDSARAWCAAFPRDSAAPPVAAGQQVTIVFPGAGEAPALRAAVGASRSAPCPAAFPQPRWTDYAAYDLTMVDSLRSGAGAASGVALAVASAARWVRDADGTVRADLDGDGAPEEARRCAADEGEHFTLWSREPRSGGGWRRRAHEYYDWGAMVEPTCRAGEDGRDGAAADGAA